MKAETLEKELAIILDSMNHDPGVAGYNLAQSRARALLFREHSAPKIAFQGYLALELLERHMTSKLKLDRLSNDICQAALDRWLGKAKQTVDMSVDQEFISLLQAYREARYEPADPLMIAPACKSAISEISVISLIPPIVPPSPSGTEARVSSTSTTQAALSADASNLEQQP